MATSVEIAVAVGELVDKITILEIKSDRIRDAAKTKNIQAELSLLRERRDQAIPSSPRLDELEAQLKSVNECLWDLEDVIRDYERRQEFGAEFIAAARKIYRANDERAAVKRRINIEFGSHILEEKSYSPY